ncbi:MAG TPA: SDR family oxidoreductase [Aggregatilineales bacterium]|nr:SDR family oxidoreductase [Aggregatilineales bacterium]
MNIIVFGANGGIGHHVVEQALAAGHNVTAVVRRPSSITTKHERLTIVQGDVLQAETLKEPMAGQEAVISALGSVSRAPTVVYSQGIANIMQAMQQAHVKRLVCISASGLDPSRLWMRLIAKPILWTLFKSSYSDLVRMEREVKGSNVDWTIVRPPRLSDGPHTGQYEFAVNKHHPRGFIISRADVADYLIAQLTNPTTYCGIVEVAY